MKEEAPNYLINVAPKSEKNSGVYTLNCRTDCLKYSFFPSTLIGWFNIDLNIRNSEPILIFKSRLLFFAPPVQTSIYDIFNPKDLTFLTGLRICASHLNGDRFWHNFQDCLNPLHSCSLDIEEISHYFFTAITFHTIILILWTV